MIAIKLTKHDLQDAHSDIETNEHLKAMDSQIDGLIHVLCDHSSSPTNTNSTLTTETNDSIHAICDFVSSGKRSDFWFGRS